MRTITKATLVLFFGAMMFACTEVPPYINYGADVELRKDTCYTVKDIPDPQDRNAMVEDISGVRCVNCPEAAEAAHAIDLKYPGRVVVATLHPTSNATLTTPIGNDTFNTAEAENIYQLIGRAQGLPTGCVNRKEFSGESRIAVAPAKWMAYAEDILAEKSIVNIEFASEVDTNQRIVKLDVMTTFTKDDPTPSFLTIMVLESGIIQPQSRRDAIDYEYEHEDILRFTHTNYSGLLLSNESQRGDVCEKSFDISIPEKINLDHVTIAVMVNKIDEDNKEVLQCTEVLLGE